MSFANMLGHFTTGFSEGLVPGMQLGQRKREAKKRDERYEEGITREDENRELRKRQLLAGNLKDISTLINSENINEVTRGIESAESLMKTDPDNVKSYQDIKDKGEAKKVKLERKQVTKAESLAAVGKGRVKSLVAGEGYQTLGAQLRTEMRSRATELTDRGVTTDPTLAPSGPTGAVPIGEAPVEALGADQQALAGLQSGLELDDQATNFSKKIERYVTSGLWSNVNEEEETRSRKELVKGFVNLGSSYEDATKAANDLQIQRRDAISDQLITNLQNPRLAKVTVKTLEKNPFLASFIGEDIREVLFEYGETIDDEEAEKQFAQTLRLETNLFAQVAEGNVSGALEHIASGRASKNFDSGFREITQNMSPVVQAHAQRQNFIQKRYPQILNKSENYLPQLFMKKNKEGVDIPLTPTSNEISKAARDLAEKESLNLPLNLQMHRAHMLGSAMMALESFRPNSEVRDDYKAGPYSIDEENRPPDWEGWVTAEDKLDTYFQRLPDVSSRTYIINFIEDKNLQHFLPQNLNPENLHKSIRHLFTGQQQAPPTGTPGQTQRPDSEQAPPAGIIPTESAPPPQTQSPGAAPISSPPVKTGADAVNAKTAAAVTGGRDVDQRSLDEISSLRATVDRGLGGVGSVGASKRQLEQARGKYQRDVGRGGQKNEEMYADLQDLDKIIKSLSSSLARAEPNSKESAELQDELLQAQNKRNNLLAILSREYLAQSGYKEAMFKGEKAPPKKGYSGAGTMPTTTPQMRMRGN